MSKLITISQLKNKKFKNTIILVGQNTYKLKYVKKLISDFSQIFNCSLLIKRKGNPERKEINLAFEKFKKKSIDSIICIGGGSVLDFGKILSIAENKIKKIDLKKINPSQKKKLVAIPTTAGTGAEVTNTAVIYNQGIKYSIEHEYIRPDLYILSPQLVLNCPKSVKAGAIFDTYSQSIEAMLSKKSNNKSTNYSIKSLNYFKKYGLNYFKKPNLKNSKKMLEAANFSGKAINIARTTAPHALSYNLSKILNISHGFSIALTFTDIMNFNYKLSDKKNIGRNLTLYKKIFKSLGLRNINNFENFNKKLVKLFNFKLNRLQKYKIKKNLNYLIQNVNQKRLRNNPIDIEKKKIREIYYNLTQ